MRRISSGFGTILCSLWLGILLANSTVAQGSKPIKAEQVRMQLVRQVPISTEVTGKLKSVTPSEEGQYVKQGDLIITVEDELIRKEVAEADAKYKSVVEIEFAKVALAKAEVDLKQRREANLKFKAFSENEIRQSELEVQKATASLAKATEEQVILGLTLETKSAQLAQYMVYAPFDGLVTLVHRWPGQSVRPGDPVLTVTDMSRLRAVLRVNYKHRGEVFVGDPVEIRIVRDVDRATQPNERPSNKDNGGLFDRGGPFAAESKFSVPEQDEVFEGEIRFIDPKLLENNSLVTMDVHVDVPNRQDKYGRYLLQEALPVEAVIIPKKRDE